MKFLRWQFWRARSRYWRKKCRDAEARYILLEVQAKAEFWRNIAREDTFASASILGGRGMWGVAPRTGPAATQRPASLLEAVQPNMTVHERMEFEAEWLPAALRSGYTKEHAMRTWLEEISKRKPLQDEPMM